MAHVETDFHVRSTLPKTNSRKTSFLLGQLPGRCYVSLRECMVFVSETKSSLND